MPKHLIRSAGRNLRAEKARRLCSVAPLDGCRGRLLAWSGEALEIGLHQNNLWCRRTSDGPWQLDVTIGEGDDEGWMYRRDPRIRFPWAEAVLRTANGIPYLAPDLQLLFKAKNPRAKDDLDAQVVIPELDQMRRDRLRWMLPSSHPWHARL